MAYLHTSFASPDYSYGFDVPFVQNMPDLSRTFALAETDSEMVLEFLGQRPVHTVAMASFIYDNGIVSPLNRGTFYGYHDRFGNLEGVALIGHTTLVEARSDEALRALAFVARKHANEIHLIMSGEDSALDFWAQAIEGSAKPRLVCREYLFEIAFPFPVRHCELDIRLAHPEELEQIAEAQAEIAFMESGVDPLTRDRKGFLDRVMRRIEQGRIFVAVENGKLLFKADVVSLTTDVAYLEGIYVPADRRGEGIGSSCLAKVGMRLMNSVRTVCLLSNSEGSNAHRSFMKAGFKHTGECTTVFV
jgi:hypothetical protein